jgi:hypothetical protein
VLQRDADFDDDKSGRKILALFSRRWLAEHELELTLTALGF